LDYNNLLHIISEWRNDFTTTLYDADLYGLEPYADLLERFRLIEQMLNDPVISEPLDTFKIEAIHPIDKFGMAPVVIQALERGIEYKDIVKILGEQGCTVSNSEVRDWHNKYSSLPITERSGFEPNSIFDTQARMQELLEELIAGGKLIEQRDDEDFFRAKTVKEREKLAYMQERRQLILAAQNLLESIHLQREFDDRMKIVIEEVNKMDPMVAARIWRRIQSMKSLVGSLRP
jgi:hypothetical protein